MTTIGNSRNNTAGPGWMLAWLLTTSLMFLLAGGIVMGLPAWLLGLMETKFLTVVFAAYLACAAIPSAWVLSGQRMKPLLTVLFAVVVFTATWLVAPLVKLNVPLSLALAMGVLAAVLSILLVPDRKAFITRLRLLAIATAVLVAVSLPATRNHWIYRALKQPTSHIIDTTLYPVQVSIFREHIPHPEVRGGGLVPAGEKVLLVTGDGLFYLLGLTASGERMAVQGLSYRAPINSKVFRQQTAGLKTQRFFRVLDVLLLDIPGSDDKQVLVSHLYWHPEQSCYAVRVSGFTMAWQDFLTDSRPAQWKTLYETTPCLRIMWENKYPFAGDGAGGRMLELGSRYILLAVGDLRFNGVDATAALAQDPAGAYGKIMEIDTADGSSRIFSSGHRTPQGLYRDQEGRIWSTEHGPRGGDELNLIRFGLNYGWPLVTLGTQYDMFVWPVDQAGQAGQAFQGPSFSWLPSIGISSLTGLDGGNFSQWQGDLMVSSLREMSLFRIRIDQDRPVLIEAIPVYERVRDIARDDQGRIIFWTDNGSIGLLRDASE